MDIVSLKTQYQRALDILYTHEPYALSAAQKSPLLLDCLNHLTDLHRDKCKAFGNIAANFALSADEFADLPYLAVRLFKLQQLQSVQNEEIFKVLTSSGTTSQVPAKVVLDAETSKRQSAVLVRILQSFLGKQRLPMLIIDAPSTVKPGSAFSARAAGIQGISIFGRRPVFALNDDMSLNWEAVSLFCEKNKAQPVLIFGFTFMVWQYFIQALESQSLNLDLPKGLLLHSGGWKKLIDQAVTNEEFKRRFNKATSVSKIHNFYGMAEQVGSVYVECEHGHLHAPVFAEVLIREVQTLRVVEDGEPGLIQTMSAIPTSYPGHSILTEDLGRILGRDTCPCGRKGTFFDVMGRLPKTEVRGCSDTVATE